MKTKTKDIAPKKKSWVEPGVKLSREEFLEGIREAEEGSFYTPEELNERFEKWKKAKGYC